jgi:LmbE family N-acetylglucosaminyl deacetylase
MTHKLQDLGDLSVLVVIAHPDDEGFGSGGALAMLSAGGSRITLVCATNGDAGEISDSSLATPETLAQVRQEEMRQAMAITKVEDLRFLGYRDSGMAGTEDNDNPASLHQAEPDKVVSRLVGIMREVRPQMVITHDPTGGYGHPDHLAASRHVTRAFTLSGNINYPGMSEVKMEPWSPGLLYYFCHPRSIFRRMWQQMVDSGITPPFASKEADSIGCPDEAITTTVDVGAFVDTKIASLNCHRTQMDPNGAFAQLPQEFTREIMGTEYYTLAVSAKGNNKGDLLLEIASSSQPM